MPHEDTGERPTNLASEASRRLVHEKVVEVTIAEDGSLSDVVRIRGRRVAAIEMPADWTAANLTFLGGTTEAGVQDVYDDDPAGATEIEVEAAEDRFIALTGARLEALAAVDYLQVRSGTSGTPVTQAAERVLKLVLK